MDPSQHGALIALIPALPFAGFLLLGLTAGRLPERWAGALGVAGPAAAFVLSVLLFAGMSDLGPTASHTHLLYDWLRLVQWQFPISVAFTWDPLSATMALVVAGVGSLIHVYSIGYMAGDRGFGRYFSYLNLFTSMMLVLVLAENLPLMFLGWEGVGLCSYLLIGFWYEDRNNTAAGMKAFVVNRIGDAAFLLGMFLVWGACGTLSFAGIPGGGERLSTGLATAIALLFFAGATGKSAQIPLYVWLPDAMAGPTPVSALIHAATMVTAGVYMIARLGALFTAAPAAGVVIAAIGAVTAFYAATIALTQWDIKKVLAYSTISQLGYMFVAMGLGAYAAGMFHLVTHAFFKALLFLAAGAVIHALGNEQDLRRMGGLARRLPLAYLAMLVGSLALSGIPPFAGFWSKDLILEKALHAAEAEHGLGRLGWTIYGLCVGGACMTAFYSFRLVALAFLGEPRSAAGETHAAGHGQGHHGPSLTMGAVLVALVVLSILGGALNLPAFSGRAGQQLGGFLAPALPPEKPEAPGAEAAINLAVTLPAAALGLVLGLAAYTRAREAFARAFSRGLLATLAAASRSAWHVDRILVGVSCLLSLGLARMFLLVDLWAIDAFAEGLPRSAYLVGGELRRAQAGRLRAYLALYALGAAALFGWVAWRLAGDG